MHSMFAFYGTFYDTFWGSKVLFFNNFLETQSTARKNSPITPQLIPGAPEQPRAALKSHICDRRLMGLCVVCVKEGGKLDASMMGWSAEKRRHIRQRCKQHAIEGNIPRARMDSQRGDCPDGAKRQCSITCEPSRCVHLLYNDGK